MFVLTGELPFQRLRPCRHLSRTLLSQLSLNALFHIEMFSVISVPGLRDVLEPIALITSLAQAVPSAAKSHSTANRSLGLHSGHTSRHSG